MKKSTKLLITGIVLLGVSGLLAYLSVDSPMETWLIMVSVILILAMLASLVAAILSFLMDD